MDRLIQTATQKPINLKDPVFLKEESSSSNQLSIFKDMREKLNETGKKKIDEDIKMLSYGIDGEKNISYELKNSFMPIIVLHDLFLEYQGLSAQIDYLVIDMHFILVIECKKMMGDIEINSKGEFIRKFKTSSGKIYKKEGIYSPIVQNQRHVEILKNILCSGKSRFNQKAYNSIIESVVVLANSKTIIDDRYAKKEIKSNIIKHDQLITYMKELKQKKKNGYWLEEETMYKIGKALLEQNKENPKDYTDKYGQYMENNKSNSSISQESIEEESIDITTTKLYKALRQYRYEKSQSEGVKPYFIYNNKQLEEIIKIMPSNLTELKKVSGIADVKCSKYGRDILKIIANNK